MADLLSSSGPGEWVLLVPRADQGPEVVLEKRGEGRWVMHSEPAR